MWELRGRIKRTLVFIAGPLLGQLWDQGQNISSANAVCLIPEHRLFGLPGLSQAIALSWSLKSIGVMFMADWLLLQDPLLQETGTEVLNVPALSSSQ